MTGGFVTPECLVPLVSLTGLTNIIVAQVAVVDKGGSAVYFVICRGGYFLTISKALSSYLYRDCTTFLV